MDEQVIIIGSGPAGLASAAELLKRGVSATVLEQGSRPAAAWAGRYDSMRFNTSRIHSALPGCPFPREWGQFPTRDQYVSYLDRYAEQHRIPIRTGVRVHTLTPARDGWQVGTDGDARHTRHVIVATGLFNRPVLPGWAQDSAFGGQLLHSAAYRNPGPYKGQDVVVVGAGSTGLEIAHELARSGARRVALSHRRPPNILLRMMGGAPADLPVPLFVHLPTGLVDPMMRAMQRRFVGDLAGWGLPEPTEGAMAVLMRRGAGTAVVDAEVIDGIRAGLFRIVPEVVALDGAGAVLADGVRLRADTVIAATGFGTGLEDLVGHLDVLGERGMPKGRSGDEVLPGLRFLGYLYRPGITGYVGRLARRAAREIAAREKAARPARGGWRPSASRTPTSGDRAGSPG